jgi:hypothetical protein
VRSEAVGVNFIDTYHRTGRYKVPLPFTLGQEAAGTVQAVGPGVTEIAAGDRVAYTGVMGAYAEKAAVPANLREAVFKEAFFLANDYQRTRQLDLQLDIMRRMVETARSLSPEDVRKFLEQFMPVPADEDLMKALEREKSRMTREVQPQIDQIEQIPNAAQRFAQAQGRGLPGSTWADWWKSRCSTGSVSLSR